MVESKPNIRSCSQTARKAGLKTEHKKMAIGERYAKSHLIKIKNAHGWLLKLHLHSDRLDGTNWNLH